ncbi:MAG: hypothetical protein AAF629_33110 [Chloroflexota bacterium]
MTQIYQQIIIEGTEKRWLVDCQAAAKAMSWIKRTPQTLYEDIIGMQTYFPHWILVAGQAGKPLRCSNCGQFYVPMMEAIRCLACQKVATTKELIWLGHLPALSRPESPFVNRREALRKKGYDEISVGEEAYLLVPLTVTYPTEWPNVEPTVRYGVTWLKTLGLPQASASHHLLSGGRACIFAWGQWHALGVALMF